MVVVNGRLSMVGSRHHVSEVGSTLVGGLAAAAPSLVQVDEVDVDGFHSGWVVFAYLAQDARPRRLLALDVRQFHVQILLHMEQVLRVEALQRTYTSTDKKNRSKRMYIQAGEKSTDNKFLRYAAGCKPERWTC
jgi:hypothetical protein